MGRHATTAIRRPVRRVLASSALFAGAVLALLAASGETTAQQPAQPQQCVNVFPPFRQNGAQLQQAVAAGGNVSVPVPQSVAAAPQITIGPTTLVGSEVAPVKQIIPSTNPSFVFVVVDLQHAHAVGEIVWPTWQGTFCAPACAPGTNAFPQCLPACPAITPCIVPSVPGVPTAPPPVVPGLPTSMPSMPAPPGQGSAAWVAFNGGWAMQVPPFVNPVPVPPLPWTSASPPPPQATVFSAASATPGAIPSPTPSGPVVYVPSSGRWLMVPSGSWTGAATVIVPVLPPGTVPSLPH